jgi:hypothetical protein
MRVVSLQIGAQRRDVATRLRTAQNREHWVLNTLVNILVTEGRQNLEVGL